jgi:hypothetical protein
MGEQILDSAGVARYMTDHGHPLTVNTIHTYHSRGDMPEKDVDLGGNPGWYKTTIDRWIKDREADAERDRKAKADRAAQRDRYRKDRS